MPSTLEQDPLHDLVFALNEGDDLPAAWRERWSAGGRDPVSAAWSASEDGFLMGALLCACDHIDLAAITQAYIKWFEETACPDDRRAGGDAFDTCYDVCEQAAASPNSPNKGWRHALDYVLMMLAHIVDEDSFRDPKLLSILRSHVPKAPRLTDLRSPDPVPDD